ncbi:hypothetical protein F1188_09290 [Roseospira marina]|uniref:Uncharacterized protein n=1 Tax=Roseospira marina TaxID=140057 RepID=A0A5M6IDG7_9PROT|nr:hypothetical protein [Roseospira marina]KAA5605799.1 hypothetical protein F1188_09290 [Roseospira marina]MBB5086776.1 hypothetical protein [Roseospira marina]
MPGRAARDATLEAVTALRQEVRALREAIDPSPDDTGSSGPATLESLSQSVRTLETYLSIGFFDRVKAALGESAEHLRPVALEQRVRRLRRLVWLVMLVQLIVLGLILALSWPTVTALAQATRVAITGWLGFDTGSP